MRHSGISPCASLLWLATCILFLALSPIQTRAQQAQPTSEIGLYGFVLLNAAFNSGAPAPIDIPVTAGPGVEGSYIMTARQSRLGLQLRHTGALKLGGQIELDLWGLMGSTSSGGPTQAAPRMRLAYFTIDASESSSWLFGQYWTVVAPLNPTSMAHVAIPPLSSSGNLWNRIPQIRYTYRAQPVTFEAALLRPFAGEQASTGTQNDYLGTGEHSRLPFAQARVAYSAGPSAVGVSGHLGRMDFRTPGLENETTATYAVAADVLLAFGSAALSGEVYTGQNTRGLFGLAGTSIRNNTVLDEKATGGWAQVSHTSGALNVNAGAGIENIHDSERQNMSFFGNGIYTIPGLPVSFAIELNYIETTPTASGEVNDNVTINFGARYSFSRWW